MEISDSQVQGIRVVQMAGDIDGSTAPEAQAHILSLLQPNGTIILDMTGVGYMSSAGLRMLLSTYRTVTGNGGRVILVGLSEDIQDTMSATGFLNFFVLQDTLDAALGVLNA